MSDLTREEIRRACEAVPGWEWAERTEVDNEPCFPCAAEADPGGAPILRFVANSVEWDADALALLVATGEPFEIQYFPGQHGNCWYEVPIHPADDGLSAKGFGSGESLQAAVVRAVNAWAESREGKTL